MAAVYPQNQPLPPNAYDPSTQAPFRDTYEQCLMMEAAAGADKVALVLAHCLGYLIRELPAEANGVVANEVVACNADFEKMKSLSQLYIDHLIRLCESSFVLNRQRPLYLLSSSTKQRTYPSSIGAP
ncbi:hypothetical protein AN958_05741 [Leucoagaricus sp. SymC.cos]|nr:hypothetical protein AN958_05741 [Leucoagaricus sp. SymC.cos]